MAPQVPTIRRNSSKNHLPAAKSANALHSYHMGFDAWCSMPVHSSQPQPQQASPCTSRSNSYVNAPCSSRSSSYVNGFSRSASGQSIGANRLVHFQVEAETAYGDSLVLVGSTEKLGSWDPKKGLTMSTDADTYPLWNLTCNDISAECDVEFKVVKLHGGGEAEWETFGGDNPFENRRLVLARDAPAAVRLSLKWGERRTIVHASTHRHQNRRPSPLSKGSGSTPSVGATPPTAQALAQQPPIIRPSSGCSIASSIDVGEPVFSLASAAVATHAARNATQKHAVPSPEAAAAAAAVAAPFTVAPRPNNSYSVPHDAEAHAAADNARREQVLRSLLQRPPIAAPPTSAAAAALADATAGCAAALPPSVTQAPPAAPRLAASAPTARPPAASTTQPLHRPGAPLDAIASMDLSWPPSPCSSPRSSHGCMPSSMPLGP